MRVTGNPEKALSCTCNTQETVEKRTAQKTMERRTTTDKTLRGRLRMDSALHGLAMVTSENKQTEKKPIKSEIELSFINCIALSSR